MKSLTVDDVYEFGTRSDEWRPLLRRLQDSNRDLQRKFFNLLVAPNAMERLTGLKEILKKKNGSLLSPSADEDEGLEGEAAPAGNPETDMKDFADEVIRGRTECPRPFSGRYRPFLTPPRLAEPPKFQSLSANTRSRSNASCSNDLI